MYLPIYAHIYNIKLNFINDRIYLKFFYCYMYGINIELLHILYKIPLSKAIKVVANRKSKSYKLETENEFLICKLCNPI